MASLTQRLAKLEQSLASLPDIDAAEQLSHRVTSTLVLIDLMEGSIDQDGVPAHWAAQAARLNCTTPIGDAPALVLADYSQASSTQRVLDEEIAGNKFDWE